MTVILLCGQRFCMVLKIQTCCKTPLNPCLISRILKTTFPDITSTCWAYVSNWHGMPDTSHFSHDISVTPTDNESCNCAHHRRENHLVTQIIADQQVKSAGNQIESLTLDTAKKNKRDLQKETYTESWFDAARRHRSWFSMETMFHIVFVGLTDCIILSDRQIPHTTSTEQKTPCK